MPLNREKFLAELSSFYFQTYETYEKLPPPFVLITELRSRDSFVTIQLGLNESCSSIKSFKLSDYGYSPEEDGIDSVVEMAEEMRKYISFMSKASREYDRTVKTTPR